MPAMAGEATSVVATHAVRERLCTLRRIAAPAPKQAPRAVTLPCGRTTGMGGPACAPLGRVLSAGASLVDANNCDEVLVKDIAAGPGSKVQRTRAQGLGRSARHHAECSRRSVLRASRGRTKEEET